LGKIDAAVLYAAKICGITEIYKIGGAQAVAAMAIGTDSIAKVDKIVGPGNSYVAMAKKILYGQVGIDMIAGPTDLTIVCDKDSIDSRYVACDALSQLEHGDDSKVFIITDNRKYAEDIIGHINNYKQKLSRSKIITKSILNSAVVLVDDISKAYEVVNLIAPEHLEIACKAEDDLVPKIENAGAIFLGSYTPESIGDYMAGPSHTLPTSGNARFSSGLSVYDFLKRISLIKCNKDSFEKLSDDIEVLSQSEGFTAHSLSVEIRREKYEG
jgi:histidinol dehydrogenase